MTAHLVKTRGFIGRMEQAQDAAGVEDCFWSLRTCSASPQCSAESARCPTHTAVRGLVLHPRSAHAGRMDAAVEWPRLPFAIRSSGSHDMRVPRLPRGKFGLGRLLHAPRATWDGEVHIAPREADCLLCAVEGKSGLDIAIILCTSRSTG